MKKIVVYVDGSNLYYGLLRKTVYRWLDLAAFANKLVGAGYEIVAIKYFASRVIDKTIDHHRSQRQDKYFDALVNFCGVQIIEGKYREQGEWSAPAKEPCVQCEKRRPDGRVKVLRITEKLTDVHIATQMLKDAYSGQAEAVAIITGDADISPAVQILKEELCLPILVFNPQLSVSNALRKFATHYENIQRKVLDGCRLPDSFTTSTGRTIHCPEAWM